MDGPQWPYELTSRQVPINAVFDVQFDIGMRQSDNEITKSMAIPCFCIYMRFQVVLRARIVVEFVGYATHCIVATVWRDSLGPSAQKVCLDLTF